jgi:hypothetical protein
VEPAPALAFGLNALAPLEAQEGTDHDDATTAE